MGLSLMADDTFGELHEPYYLPCWPRSCCFVCPWVFGPKMNAINTFTAIMMRRFIAFFVTLLATCSIAQAEKVGNVDVDWLGNDLVIEAFSDPKVEGVTCHVAYFDRGLIDRLQNGNWFEDPSNSALSCRQTGALTMGDIDLSDEGESVFSERRSAVWKSLSVKRIFDKKNQTLVYISHAREVQNGSAKMSISTVPLFQKP